MNPDNMRPPRLSEDRVQNLTEGETLLVDTRRDIFGLISIYMQAIFGLGGALLLIFLLLPGLLDGSAESSAISAAINVLSMVAIILLGIFLLLITFIYRTNRLIITNKNISLVMQHGLFHRKVSELSMSNVEDVTAVQKGIMAQIFGYGNVIIETAGEQHNFIFDYCPKPNATAKALLDARQKFLDSHHSIHL